MYPFYPFSIDRRDCLAKLKASQLGKTDAINTDVATPATMFYSRFPTRFCEANTGDALADTQTYAECNIDRRCLGCAGLRSTGCIFTSFGDVLNFSRNGDQSPESHFYQCFYCVFSSTGGGGRTRTWNYPYRILNPARLPFRHSGGT